MSYTTLEDATPAVTALLQLSFIKSLHYSIPTHVINVRALCEALRNAPKGFQSLALLGPTLEHNDAREIPALLRRALRIEHEHEGNNNNNDNANNNNNNNNDTIIAPKGLRFQYLAVRDGNTIYALHPYKVVPYLKDSHFPNYRGSVGIWNDCTLLPFHRKLRPQSSNAATTTTEDLVRELLALLEILREPIPNDNPLEGLIDVVDWKTQQELNEFWDPERPFRTGEGMEVPDTVVLDPFISPIYELFRYCVGNWCGV